MDSLLPFLSIFFIFAFVAVFGLFSNKRANGGYWFWERRTIERTGSKGTAVVLKKINLPESWSSGRYYRPVEAVIEVTIEGQAPYRTSITRDILRFGSELNEGETLPVYVDLHDKKRVIIDAAEMKRASDARESTKRSEAEAEKRRLLDG